MESIKRLLMFWIMLLTACSLFSQDNLNYSTPLGHTVYFKSLLDANRMTLSMAEIDVLKPGNDLLTVVCALQAVLFTVDKPLKIMSFTTSTESNSFLDIFYDNGTIMIRRKFSPGSSFYYDYRLYDPMFTALGPAKRWIIYVYFTGYYLWIETQDMSKLIENHRHAPVFFGLDLPSQNFMELYLARSSNAKIIFGDPNPPVQFTMPGEVSVNEFKYSDLKDELQKNFSDVPN